MKVGEYITVSQAATILGVDRKTIDRKIASGELPAFKIGTKHPDSIKDTRPVRIRASALVAILEPMNGEVGYQVTMENVGPLNVRAIAEFISKLEQGGAET